MSLEALSIITGVIEDGSTTQTRVADNDHDIEILLDGEWQVLSPRLVLGHTGLVLPVADDWLITPSAERLLVETQVVRPFDAVHELPEGR